MPQKHIETALKIAHDLPTSGHEAIRRTNDRILMSFFFPGQMQRVKSYCDSCNICQLRARERRSDLLPIKPIDRHEDNFGRLQGDINGPTSHGGVRLIIDFRYLNFYSHGDAFTMPHLQDTIQTVGAAQYITVLDAKSGYWQLGLREEDRWLSAFAYDDGMSGVVYHLVCEHPVIHFVDVFSSFLN